MTYACAQGAPTKNLARATALLVTLLVALLLPGIADAQTPTRWSVAGSGTIENAKRGYSVALQSGDGNPRGTARLYDRDVNLRFTATQIESLVVEGGAATVVGVGRINQKDGYRFKLVIREPAAGAPARISFDASGPDFPAYHTDGAVKSGTVRLVDRTPKPRTVTPTRSPTVTRTATPEAPKIETVAHSPRQDSSLRSADGLVSVSIPAGAVSTDTTFQQMALALPDATPPQVKLARVFELSAADATGDEVSRFAAPLTLTVSYTDADLQALGVAASELKLFYQADDARWMKLSSTVDSRARTVTGQTDHLTVFAVGTGEGFESSGTSQTTFSDDMANLNGWTLNSGAGTSTGNVLVSPGSANTRSFWTLTNGAAHGDMTFDAAITDNSRNALHKVGMVVHHSAGGYYVAALHNNNIVLERRNAAHAVQQSWSPATGLEFAYLNSTFYWVKVAVSGSTVTVSTAPGSGGVPGAYTQRITNTGDLAPLTSGTIGFMNENLSTTVRGGRMQQPKISQALPADWTGPTQLVANGETGVIWDKTASSAHGGTGSLQLFSGHTGNSGYAAQTTNNTVTGGTTQALSGWIKTSAVSGTARILLIEQPGGTQTVLGSTTGTTGWTQYTGLIAFQPSTTSVIARVELTGSGTANFDDIVVNVSAITATPTATPTVTQTATSTRTRTSTVTRTPTMTRTITQTRTPTRTRTATHTRTITGTPTQTRTRTPTRTRTLTRTRTPTRTRTSTVTQTRTFTRTPTVTQTATRTATSTATATVTFTPTQTPTATPCSSPCDGFNRADAPTLGTSTSGHAWQQRSGVALFGICSGEACAQSAGGDGTIATIDGAMVDQRVSATIAQRPGQTGTAGLVVRARADWSRMLLVEMTDTGLVTLWRYSAGHWGQIAFGSTTLAAGSSHVLAVSVQGQAVTVTIDGTPVTGLAPAYDTNDTAGTYAGIYVGATGTSAEWPRFDSFAIQTPTGPAPNTPTPTHTVVATTPTNTPAAPTNTPWPNAAADGFNRTDGSGLAKADSGHSWLSDGSSWVICANRACTGGPAGTGNYVRLETGVFDQRVTVTIPARPVGSIGAAGLLAGVTSDWNTNMLWVGLEPSGLVEVWTLVGGTWSNGAIHSTNTGLTSTVSRTLRVSTSGTTLNVYVDGGLVLGPVVIPAAPATGTKAGLYADTTSAQANWPRFDDFAVVAGP